jgi:molybdopterin-containing oxidoreductase family membrane subunit
MQGTTLEEKLWRPMFHTTKRFYIVLGISILGIVGLAFAWITQLRTGLVVTGLGDIPGGVPWGIYIVGFVYFAGIAAVGTTIASTIRLFQLKRYIPLARIAEVTSVFALLMALLCIVADLGRPDRLFNLVRYYPQRLASSPLVWDVTAISIYAVFAVTYLYIEMREDLAKLAEKGRLKWLYKLLLPAYEPGERERIVRVVRWASILNFPLMVIVETVVGWIFGLMVGRPGWYSAIMGPYFVAGAVLSGLAFVVVIAAIYRTLYDWQEHIAPTVFKGIGKLLAWVSLVYIYFLLTEFMTVKFSGPIQEFKVSVAWTNLEYAWLYWLQIAALVIACVLFFANVVFPQVLKIWTTVLASIIVVVALWVTRFLIIVPSLAQPYLPYPTGSYTPTWVEWSIVGGTFALLIFLFLLFTKVFPIMPLTEIIEAEEASP